MHAKIKRSSHLPPRVYLVHNEEIIAEVKIPEGLKSKDLCDKLNKVLEEG